VYGLALTFTATVSAAAPGAGTPSGTVTFLDGAVTIATGTLNGSGVATYTTSTLTVGSHSITAVYGGDLSFITSTSGAVNQSIVPDSATAVTANVNPSTYGGSVTFTAWVPRGTVEAARWKLVG
jgi:Bacterial Ig-like domain (group 3)